MSPGLVQTVTAGPQTSRPPATRCRPGPTIPRPAPQSAICLVGNPASAGLEDHAGPGEPANADLLRAAVALVERLGRAPATPGETRRLLGVA